MEGGNDSPRLVVRNTFIDVDHRALLPRRARTWDASYPSTWSQESGDLPLRPATRRMDPSDAGESGEESSDAGESEESDQSVDSSESHPSAALESAQSTEEVAQSSDEDDDAAAYLHRNRKCVPCVASVVTKECRAVAECRYCHLSHEANMEQGQRPAKQLRNKLKREILRCRDDNWPDLPNMLDALQALAVRESAFERNYVVSVLRDGQFLQTVEPGSATGASSSSAGPANVTSVLASRGGTFGGSSSSAGPALPQKGGKRGRAVSVGGRKGKSRGRAAGGSSSSSAGPALPQKGGNRGRQATVDGRNGRQEKGKSKGRSGRSKGPSQGMTSPEDSMHD
eukprot:TRINITY_DN13574_c0_g1_i1.p1 TRINITY_DN13574_c0_g1~~TRINITY_DN13574_c0_g1_i1.p1  ORF type:complete len:340 (+),score=23.27 TRINITY_DN13574_c0_g1_i1:66-1085(+)